MPTDLFPSLIVLGFALGGMVLGVILRSPEPHLFALRSAQRARLDQLREGELVCVEGTLTTLKPLEGPVSREAVAVQRLEYARHREQPMGSRRGHTSIHAELRYADDLCVTDGHGRAFLDLEGATLLTTRRFIGSERTLGDLHWRRVAIEGTDHMYESSLAPGAKVVAIGTATWLHKGWRLQGRDVLLTDVTREALEASDRRGRLLGTGVIVCAAGVGAAALLNMAI
jgi:hypothetical protein